MTIDRPTGEIGGTPLVGAPRLAVDLGAGTLRLKLESVNPSRVQKDRAAAALVEAARSAGWRGVTLGTCGNLGVAVARFAGRAGLTSTIFVPARYRSRRIDEIESAGGVVLRALGGYEEAVITSGAHAARAGLFDANPCGPGGVVSLAAYRRIATEIREVLDGWPDSIWVSVGNGTTLAGIGQGVLQDGTGRLPRVCGAGSLGNTAAIRSILVGTVVELDPGSLRESPTNEPLLNWRSLHAAEALAVVLATGGIGHECADRDLESMARRLLEAEGVVAIPAACAALVGLEHALMTGALRPGLHVVVLTG
jgi:threonine synthase